MKKFLIIVGVAIFFACTDKPSFVIEDKSVSSKDTLVFYFEETKETIKDQQLLKVVNTSDSTIWFSLEYVNVTGYQKIEGDGIDLYYNLDPEIDEIEGEAHPVLEFETKEPNKGLNIRVDMMEQNFAKVLTTPDFSIKAQPIGCVLKKR